MKYNEMRRICRENPLAFARFKDHISNQSSIRGFFIHKIFFLSFLSLFTRIPVLGRVSLAIQGLFAGYVVEFNMSKKTKNEEFAPVKVRFQNAPSQNEFFDHVIIGSGPGAATAALKLRNSPRVLILESGDVPKTPLSEHHTLAHVLNDFSKSGQEIVISPWMPQFAQANVLGGGSEVNSGLYHRLPEHLINPLTYASSICKERYLDSEEFIQNLLKISFMNVDQNDSPIFRGATKLNLESENIPRWRSYSDVNTYIQHGMNDLVWSDLASKENFVVRTNSRVVRIDNTNLKRIRISYLVGKDKVREIECNNLIVAAGTVQTPYLLCKSNIIDWSDTRFQWHPMIRTVIKTRTTDLGLHDLDPFQAWTSDRQFKFGSAVSTPGLLAMNLGQILSRDEIQSLRSLYVSFVSSGRGGLVPGTDNPWYMPSRLDRVRATNATQQQREIVRSSGGTFANNKDEIKKAISTVHVFGSLPLGSNLYSKGTSKLRSDDRIQISDGSLLPFGPGVNPQAVIMALCNALVTD